jgi:hypothetical protein
MTDFRMLTSVEDTKLSVKRFDFPSEFAAAFISPSKHQPDKLRCSFCKKHVITSKEEPCTLVNIHTQQLACLDHNVCRKNMMVHIYHWRCLCDYVKNEFEAICCIICYGQGKLQNEAPWLNQSWQDLPPIEKLGVDIGGVIVAARRDDSSGKISGESFFGDNFLQTPPELNCFQILKRLVSERFGPQNVYLISKSQPQNQQRTLQWLHHFNFFSETGILEKNIHFCLERKQKREICQRLGINHFIDDRLDVLDAIHDLPSMKSALLFGSSSSSGEYQSIPLFYSPTITKADNWNSVAQFFLTK